MLPPRAGIVYPGPTRGAGCPFDGDAQRVMSGRRIPVTCVREAVGAPPAREPIVRVTQRCLQFRKSDASLRGAVVSVFRSPFHLVPRLSNGSARRGTPGRLACGSSWTALLGAHSAPDRNMQFPEGSDGLCFPKRVVADLWHSPWSVWGQGGRVVEFAEDFRNPGKAGKMGGYCDRALAVCG